MSIATERPDELNEIMQSDFLTNHAWVTFAPTVTQSGAVSLTVTFARYIVLANTVIVQARLAITGAGTGNNAIVIAGLPTAILPGNTVASEHVVGTGLVNDVGTLFYQGALVYVGVNDFRMQAHGVTGVIGITPNFALANGDFIGFQGSWER